jgi:DNA-binding NarL/FixJ family response regulator
MNKVRMLLADDHAIVRAGIRKTIEEIDGLEVVGEVGDGPQVFAVLKQEWIDCLLIDVTMPNFEPIAAIRNIKTLYPSLKILVVSAYDDDIYVQGLLGAGVNGYHMKDQPLNDLKLAVQQVLAGERWISSSLITKLYPRATIYEAMDIQNSVNLAQQVDLRLALVDVVLGDEYGITCVRRIKAINPQIRIVLISAYPDREFHHKGLQAGAVAFLDKKDLDLPVLRQVIDDVIL